MRKLFYVMALTLFSMGVLSAAPKEVVFLGDSITEGFGIPKEQRLEFRYPTVFGRLLEKDRPNKYKVVNFGHCGRTLLSNVKKAWGKVGYKEIESCNPYMAIIMLGTNDSKCENWTAIKGQKAQYKKDLLDIISRLKKQNKKVKIYLCTPPPSFSGDKLKDGDGISGVRVKKDIIPIIREVAKKERLPVIDMFKKFRHSRVLFADGVHPNVKGADAFAKFIYKQVKKDLK